MTIQYIKLIPKILKTMIELESADKVRRLLWGILLVIIWTQAPELILAIKA